MVSTISFLIALINLAIDREKEVGEINLKEDLFIIREYFEKAIELLKKSHFFWVFFHWLV